MSSTAIASTPKRTELTMVDHESECCPLIEKMIADGDLYDKIVTVEVGEGDAKETHYLHEGLLCHHSSFFRGAIKGGFAESVDRTIRLKDTDNALFTAFKRWLYSAKIPFSKELTKDVHSFLINLWIFGDMRGIPALQNAAVDELIGSIAQHWKFPTYEICNIYSNTSTTAPLRRFLVDCLAFCWEDLGEWAGKSVNAPKLPAEFFCDLLKIRGGKTMVKTCSQKDFKKINKCQYHVHDAPNQGRPSAQTSPDKIS